MAAQSHCLRWELSPPNINLVNSSDVLDRFRELFEGVGMLKNYDLERHGDSSLTPIAQPRRRVTF